jgi:hypothetical protein
LGKARLVARRAFLCLEYEILGLVVTTKEGTCDGMSLSFVGLVCVLGELVYALPQKGRNFILFDRVI